MKPLPRWIVARMKGLPPSTNPSSGFTFVEILVSSVILLLLLGMVAQLTQNTTATSTNSRKRMDADGQARMIFDRMANDFAGMVKRTDVDYIFAKQIGNDSLFFYSEAPAYFNTSGTAATGYAAKSTVALVGYRINSNLQLERLGKGLTWDGATVGVNPGSAVFLTYTSGTATPDPHSAIIGNWPSIGTASLNFTDGADADYHVLADQAYRLEISFILNDGSISAKPVSNPSSTTNNLTATAPPTASCDSTQNYAPGSRWYDNTNGKGYVCMSAFNGAAVWSPIGIQDIMAIIVGIGLLDRDSRKIVIDTSFMVAALPDTSGTNQISKTWSGSSYLTQSGIPKAAAAHIRFYQRTFYFNNK